MMSGKVFASRAHQMSPTGKVRLAFEPANRSPMAIATQQSRFSRDFVAGQHCIHGESQSGMRAVAMGLM